MSVGLIDQDALLYGKNFYFDLSIMKLASYYKSKYEVTKLLLDARDYYQYSQIYFVKNKYNYKICSEMLLSQKIKYVGYAFTPRIYEPFPEDIEKAIPDTTIYDTFLKYDDKLCKRVKNNVLNKTDFQANHARLSTDNLTCNVPDESIIYKNSNKLTLYDYNILKYEDSINKIMTFKDKELQFKYMPRSNFDDIKYILENLKISYENNFIIQNVDNQELLDDIINFSKNYSDKLKISVFDNIDISNEEQFIQRMIQVFKIILYIKKIHVRLHTDVEQYYINHDNTFLNNIFYWCNKSHSDCSFVEYCISDHRSHKKVDLYAQKNDELKYLINLRPTQFNGGVF